MGKLHNMKIGSTLIVSYLVLILLFVATLAGTLVGVNMMSRNMDEFYNEEYQIVKASQAMQTDLQCFAKDLSRMSLGADNPNGLSAPEQDALIQKREDEMLSSLQDLQSQLATLNGFTLQSVDELATLNAAVGKLPALADSFVALCDQRNAADASDLLRIDIDAAGLAANNSLNTIIDRADARAEAKYQEVQAFGSTLFIASAIVAIVVVAVALLLSYRISRSITRPLNEMETAARRLSEGDLEQRITYESGNELGSFANSLRETVASLQRYIKEIDLCLDSIGRGQLNYQSTVEFKGDFDSLKVAVDGISASLSKAMTQINMSADQVLSGAEQIAGSGQALSQATLEQASSVEELSATINEVSEHVVSNAEKAMAATELAEQVSAEVLAGSQSMEALSVSMNEMRDMAKEITGIVKEIEDIAFQTNILSLNAAVEAARAGEAGKGFSVVASEIRRLSGKTTEASRSTAQLIGRTADTMVQNAVLAGEASKRLQAVAASTVQAKEKVEGISQASNDQATSIVQLRESIDQIASVVQENSATAEESAASSEELSGQMRMLKDLVATFEYDE